MEPDSFASALFLFVVVLWIMAGFIAFIMSLVCFGYQGSITDKMVGFLIAIIIGPFYWIYYSYNGAYCLSNS